MLRSISALAVLAATPAAHADEVTDVLLLPGEQQLWIALDQQPDALDFQSSTGVITLTLTGFQATDVRTISPAASNSVAGVMIAPGPTGTAITIEGRFGPAYAELRQGGVLIDWSGGAYQIAASQPARPEPGGAEAVLPTPTPAASGHARAEPGMNAQEHASLTDQPGTPSASFRIAEPREVALEDQAASPVSDAEPARPVPPGPSTPALTQPLPEPAIEVDSSGVPGETELVETQAEPAVPGPCDPTAAAVASSPWDLDALAAHAACLIRIGETVNGAGLYERVLAFDPSHFQAALGLARLREQQGRRADAARLFETAADAALTDGQALAARQSARRLRDEN